MPGGVPHAITVKSAGRVAEPSQARYAPFALADFKTP